MTHGPVTAAGLDVDRGKGFHGVPLPVEFNTARSLEHDVDLSSSLVIVRAGILLDVDEVNACCALAGFRESATGQAAWAGARRELIELNDGCRAHGASEVQVRGSEVWRD
jgi:hypothetical protein